MIELPTKAAAELLGYNLAATDSQMKALRAAGLEPLNKPIPGAKRLFARWDMEAVQHAAAVKREKEAIEKREADIRAEERRRQEAQMLLSKDHTPQALEIAIPEFTRVLTQLYAKIGSLEKQVNDLHRQVNDLHRVWCEESKQALS
jgi:predicted  nucleic acid-binding Zn-ribbon protein